MEILYKLDSFSPEDPRDFQAENIFPEDYDTPEVYDPREKMLPIRSQGVQGSCVAHSCACMKELNEKQNIGFSDYMSPQWVYNFRVNQEGEGMYPRDSMKILYKYGILPEEEYPYGKREIPDQIAQDKKDKALNYKVKGYAYVNTVKALKVAILKNGACAFTVPVYHGGKDMWRPANQGDVVSGGHSMTAIGWTKEGFILRNSWGASWADSGYTIFPFEHWGMQAEVWAVIDDDSTKPDPKYSKWYWKAWRGVKNIFVNSGAGGVMYAMSFTGFFAAGFSDPVIFIVPGVMTVLATYYVIKNKLYLIKDKK